MEKFQQINLASIQKIVSVLGHHKTLILDRKYWLKLFDWFQERVEAAVEDEILLMSQLRHRNIVRLLGAVRLSTCFCVFTEWMAGGSVSSLLEKYGPFSEPVLLRYIKQVRKKRNHLGIIQLWTMKNYEAFPKHLEIMQCEVRNMYGSVSIRNKDPSASLFCCGILNSVGII